MGTYIPQFTVFNFSTHGRYLSFHVFYSKGFMKRQKQYERVILKIHSSESVSTDKFCFCV